jgi:hypothetical protein
LIIVMAMIWMLGVLARLETSLAIGRAGVWGS